MFYYLKTNESYELLQTFKELQTITLKTITTINNLTDNNITYQGVKTSKKDQSAGVLPPKLALRKASISARPTGGRP